MDQGTLFDIRYAPDSGAKADIAGLPLRAMCGRLRVDKENLHFAALVGAAMCFGLFARFT
jgi:hypothetical protein